MNRAMFFASDGKKMTLYINSAYNSDTGKYQYLLPESSPHASWWARVQALVTDHKLKVIITLITLLTRFALKNPAGQVITSAIEVNNCSVTLTAPTTQINLPLKAQCTSTTTTNITTNITSNSDDDDDSSMTFWRLGLLSRSRVHGQPVPKLGFQLLPFLFSSLFCLTTGDASSSSVPYLSVGVCEKAILEQQFVITVEAVSMERWRVYFSIRSLKHPSECIGLQQDIMLKEHLVFVMKPCIAGQASQYFFLGGVDYNTAIADYQQQKKKKSVKTAVAANADGEVNNMIKFI
ncbi:hypothetical protein TYRP_016842 [Tyrophagus putrescentiae]|nr:hypothetical protein TYRP_016842 [Tyrophagus putrescentiae]